MAVRGWRDRHGRFYDLAHLMSRIRDQRGPLRMRIVTLTNAAAVHPQCYARFVGVFERP